MIWIGRWWGTTEACDPQIECRTREIVSVPELNEVPALTDKLGQITLSVLHA
jgi:hypothetical protein